MQRKRFPQPKLSNVDFLEAFQSGCGQNNISASGAKRDLPIGSNVNVGEEVSIGVKAIEQDSVGIVMKNIMRSSGFELPKVICSA